MEQPRCSGSSKPRESNDSTGLLHPGSVALTGVFALAVSKASDLSTTVIGLRLQPILVERNPIAVAFISEYGLLPGLAVFSVVTVTALTLLIEGAFAVLERTSAHVDAAAGRWGRLVCYGVGSACNVSFAVYNTVLILSVSA